MSLGWVQAIVALFVATMISLTGLLTVVAILLPGQAEKGKRALEESPRKCFWAGIGMLFLFVVGLVISNVPVPLIKLAAFLMITGITAVLTVGGAGMAQLMGARIADMSGARTSFGALVRGSFAFSVAVFFPYIGWFALAPLCILFNLGAGILALLPERRTRPVIPNAWQPQVAVVGGPVMTFNPVHATPQMTQEQPTPYDLPAYNAQNATTAPLPPMNPPQENAE